MTVIELKGLLQATVDLSVAKHLGVLRSFIVTENQVQKPDPSHTGNYPEL